jgi:periplasmic protein TonB
MRSRSKAQPNWLHDRFMVCLVAAVALHALIVLGVRFGPEFNPVPRLADTLDVVLVKWRSEKAPDKPDYLAQANQQGGGESTEKHRPSQPESGILPIPADGHEALQSAEEIPLPQTTQREVITRESEQGDVKETTEIEQPDIPAPSAARLMRQSMDMASMQPELSQHRQFVSKLPRRKQISANTKQYEFAAYMSAWVSKVERVGNLNYPAELRQRKLHGDLVLSVGIHQNGSIESIQVLRSSGIAEIDDAARNIVQLAGPYAPLPDNIAEQVDILQIVRTWRFETTFGSE